MPFNQDQLTPVPIKKGYISLKCNKFFVSKAGSAFIIDKGYAITNRHVVEGSRKVVGHMAGGIKFSIEKKILSDKFDLALLRIPVQFGEAMPLGDKVKSGDRIFTAGTSQSITLLEGIVRDTKFLIRHQGVNLSEAEFHDNLGRPIVSCFVYEGKVHKGFSGGPIVNGSGELVGMNQGYVTGFLQTENAERLDKSKSYAIGYHISDIIGEIHWMMAQFDD